MYYTGKGDKGTSSLYNLSDRISKADEIFEVLGSLDELNSYLGLVSVGAKEFDYLFDIIKKTQQNLFIIQAYFAKSDIEISKNLLEDTENIIKDISLKIKPRNSFVLSGGSHLSATLDICRTLARKTERRAIRLNDRYKNTLNELVFAYLNRLSSLLYVLARLANDFYNLEEDKPNYNK